MKSRPRMSPQTLCLLEALLGRPASWHYGYELSLATGLKSGTLYPILMRLAKHSWLETRWEMSKPIGKPPRHLYRLTGEGVRLAREELRAARHRRILPRPAFGEEGA